MKAIGYVIISAFALGACADSGAAYRPIVDGPSGAAFSGDLTQCQEVAKQRRYDNGQVRSDAVAGAAIGGLLTGLSVGIEEGDAGDGLIAGLIGAAFGAAVGGGKRALATQEERRAVVVACMQGRGHNVVG